MLSRLAHVFFYLGSLYLLFFALEKFWPLRAMRHSLSSRIVTNVAMSATAFGTSALFVQPVAATLLNSADERGFGFLNLWDFSWSIELVLSLLLLDLSFYYWHRLNHEWPFLWRFHNIHHVDIDLDVTTGFRFHPGEIVFSAGFRTVQVAILGPSVWSFFVYEVVFQAGTLFHHSNLRLPLRVEKILNFVLVTPRMHGLHHSVLKHETNSNYSVVFSVWDRFHKTLTPVTRSQNEIGVPAYGSSLDNSFFQLLKTPFTKQRDYWKKSDLI